MSIYIVSVQAIVGYSEYEGYTRIDKIFHVCTDLETAQELYNKIDNTIQVCLKQDYSIDPSKDNLKVTHKTLSKAHPNSDISDVRKLEILEEESLPELVLTDKFPSLDTVGDINLLNTKKQPYDCLCYDAGYGRIYYYVEPDVSFARNVDETSDETSDEKSTWLMIKRKRGTPSIRAHEKRGLSKKLTKTQVEQYLIKLKNRGYKMIVRDDCRNDKDLNCVDWDFEVENKDEK